MEEEGQPARALVVMARMPKFIVVRCTLCCRPVGFDSLAGFPTQEGSPLGEKAV